MKEYERELLKATLRQRILILERQIEALQISVYGRVKKRLTGYKGTKDKLYDGRVELAPLRRRFVQEFPKDMNATRAARRAGYAEASAAVAGCNLLKDPRIVKELRKEFNRITHRNRIDQDRVVGELACLAYSNIKSFASWNSSGLSLVDSDILSHRDTACIKEIKEVVGAKSTTVSIKLHDKLGALRTLSQYLNILDGQGSQTHTPEKQREVVHEFVRGMFNSIPSKQPSIPKKLPENVRKFDEKLTQLEERIEQRNEALS